MLIKWLKTRIEAERQAWRRWNQPSFPGGSLEWIENSMRWLIEQYGDEPLHRPVVLPSKSIPADYDGSEEAALSLCLRVCERMGVSAERIRFSFRLDEVRLAGYSRLPGELARVIDGVLTEDLIGEMTEVGLDPEEFRAEMVRLAAPMTPAEVLPVDLVEALDSAGLGPEVRRVTELGLGWWTDRLLAVGKERDQELRAELMRATEAESSGRFARLTHGLWMRLDREVPGYTAIVLRSNLRADPALLTAVVVHELGHEVLTGSGLVPLKQWDAEQLTDLFGVFHGFGIFGANASYRPVPGKGRFAARMTMGYLGPRLFMDALGYYLFLRGTRNPEWRWELDGTVRDIALQRAARLDKEVSNGLRPRPERQLAT